MLNESPVLTITEGTEFGKTILSFGTFVKVEKLAISKSSMSNMVH